MASETCGASGMRYMGGTYGNCPACGTKLRLHIKDIIPAHEHGLSFTYCVPREDEDDSYDPLG